MGKGGEGVGGMRRGGRRKVEDNRQAMRATRSGRGEANRGGGE